MKGSSWVKAGIHLEPLGSSSMGGELQPACCCCYSSSLHGMAPVGEENRLVQLRQERY